MNSTLLEFSTAISQNMRVEFYSATASQNLDKISGNSVTFYSKFMKKFFFIKLQFRSIEYSVYFSLEILILVIGIILRFGN